MKKKPLPTRVETVIIKKSLATSARQAASIARSHGAKTTKVDETGQSYRFRQHPPENYLPNSFRAFVLNKHVTLVYGTPKGREKALKKIAAILDGWPRLSGKKYSNPSKEDTRTIASIDRLQGAAMDAVDAADAAVLAVLHEEARHGRGTSKWDSNNLKLFRLRADARRALQRELDARNVYSQAVEDSGSWYNAGGVPYGGNRELPRSLALWWKT
jgi:hypothetical protein